MKAFKRSVVGLVAFFFTVGVIAQSGDCPTIVESALESLAIACENTGRNQACYGNDTVRVQANGNVSFDNIGDVIDIAEIAGIETTALDESQGTWGISLLRVQADLPDTLPGQNVTMLIFGDTQVLNDAEDLETISVTANDNVNVRFAPSTDADVVVSISRNTVLEATGRLEDSTWLRVRLESGDQGWLSAQYVGTEQSFANLAVVPADDIAYQPMQAFFVRTGIGDAACEEAPRSGVLVQTPEGVGEINLSINGLEVDLGSTAFIQARPNDIMELSVFEGQATIRANGVEQIVPAGTWAKIPVDGEGRISGAPRPPRPYRPEEMHGLPLGVFGIEMPPPLTDAELLAIVDPTPNSGEWLVQVAGANELCQIAPFTITASRTAEGLLVNDVLYPPATAANAFSATLTEKPATIQMINATRMEGNLEVAPAVGDTPAIRCRLVMDFTG